MLPGTLLERGVHSISPILCLIYRGVLPGVVGLVDKRLANPTSGPIWSRDAENYVNPRDPGVVAMATRAVILTPDGENLLY